MESKEFLAYINNPVAVDAQSLKQIEEVQKEYPFCQTAHLLFALNLYAEEHPQYAVQLKRASAYAADRRQLKHLIDKYRLVHPKPATPKLVLPVKSVVAAKSVEPQKTPTPLPLLRHHLPTSPPPHLPTSPPSLSPRVAFKPIIPGTEEPRGGESLREKLLEIVHRRLIEIAEEHGESPNLYTTSQTDSPPVVVPGRQRVTFSLESPGPLSKEELIEKFIREEPRISSPRKVQLKLTYLAPRDPQEDDEIVSETLAILYHKQGNTGKSIRVYEKLCLLSQKKVVTLQPELKH